MTCHSRKWDLNGIGCLPARILRVGAGIPRRADVIAMIYLRTKGFQSKYLEDGLLGLAEYLRGDRAREFIE